jgi:ribonuclease P protein component
VLPRVHRIVAGEDFRLTQRQGRRSVTTYFVLTQRFTTAQSPTRFGAVVSKKVGNAVTRNRVKRRLRALAMVWVGQVPLGVDVVVRALPESAGASFKELSRAWLVALDKQAK